MSDVTQLETVNAHEAERLVESIKTFAVKDIGSKAWLQQHESIEKLNIQAHLNAVAMRDDYIAEALIAFQKLPTLIHELLAIELWREKVYPCLVALDFAAKSTITPYIVYYHEATLITLLEAVLYNREACESCGDAALDLLDYVHRQIVRLIARKDDAAAPALATKDILELTGQKQLEQQIAPLPFDIATKSVTILRYLTDAMTNLPLGVMTRMLNVHGKLEKYSEGQWGVVAPADRLRITKPEAQVWLAEYNLVMEPECRRKYAFNSFNKEELSKLRGYFNEVLVDQLPILGELRRTLEQLAISTPPAPEPSVILEQLPEIRDHLVKVCGNKWKKIAEAQYASYFNLDDDALRANAKRSER